MSNAKKMYFAVAGGLVALGLVLAGIGFIASGFDPAVFSTQIDFRGEGTVVLGGVEVDDPTKLPLIAQVNELGEIDVAAVSAPEAR